MDYIIITSFAVLGAASTSMFMGLIALAVLGG